MIRYLDLEEKSYLPMKTNLGNSLITASQCVCMLLVLEGSVICTAQESSVTASSTLKSSVTAKAINPQAVGVEHLYDIWRGTNALRDMSQVKKLSKQFASDNDPLGTLMYSRIVSFSTHDDFPPTDFRQTNQLALKHLPAVRVLADQGNALAIYLEAFCLQHGVGVLVDREAAAKLHRKAAEMGVTAAMVALGQMAERRNNWAEARKQYDAAAEQGDFQAFVLIGDSYQYGHGQRLDIAKGMEWKTKAAERGDAYAMFEVAYYLNNGIGVHKDTVKAIEWFKKSAETGYEPAGEMLPKNDISRLAFSGIWSSWICRISQD